MIRKLFAMTAGAALLLSLAGCQAAQEGGVQPEEHLLSLADNGVSLDHKPVAEDSEPVTVGHEIIYYQAGQGSGYGEGSDQEAHDPQEAREHTVVTIRQPGTYRVTGTLSLGQLAVDLGEGSERDPDAVVALVLDNASITCTVAPALIFYNVYECDTAWMAAEEGYSGPAVVDTSAAGARIVLAEGSENTMTGSHVAKIYQPGTTKKLHKYDGAVYSRMSMNLDGEGEGTGVLRVVADNEGLDSELHLTINGGYIAIQAQNDGINTNEDGVSVTTINGGTLEINAGLGAEGDGIDSNGHLVINGGNVYAMASAESMDSGLDADGEVRINGGYVVALGNMSQPVSENSAQRALQYTLGQNAPAQAQMEILDAGGEAVLSFETEKACRNLLFSSPDLGKDEDYTLTVDGVAQAAGDGPQGGPPEGFPGGGRPPEEMGGRREIPAPPEGLEEWLAAEDGIPQEIRSWLEELLEFSRAGGAPAPPSGP